MFFISKNPLIFVGSPHIPESTDSNTAQSRAPDCSHVSLPSEHERAREKSTQSQDPVQPALPEVRKHSSSQSIKIVLRDALASKSVHRYYLRKNKPSGCAILVGIAVPYRHCSSLLARGHSFHLLPFPLCCCDHLNLLAPGSAWFQLNAFLSSTTSKHTKALCPIKCVAAASYSLC